MSALSSVELLTGLTRITQALFHHLHPPAALTSPRSASSFPSSAAAVGAAAEAQLLSCVVRSPLSSSFLSSTSSPALFHRGGVFPAPSSLAPRFLASLASLRSLAAAHAARLRSSAAAPAASSSSSSSTSSSGSPSSAAALERLSFISSSLSSVQAQQAAVSAGLSDCRARLREEVEQARAAAAGESAFHLAMRGLQRLARHLGLQSEEDADGGGGQGDAALLSLSPPSSALPPSRRVHLASGGSTSCFVIELSLRRASPSLSAVVERVHAEWLQGDAEVREMEVDEEVAALLSDGRFAALQRQLSHVLAMEALSDRFPHSSLYQHQQQALQCVQQLQKTKAQQPLVVRRALDGLQLHFHHTHTHAHDAVEQQPNPLHLFLTTQHARSSRFPSHPDLAFTHSLTFIGVEEDTAHLRSTSPSFSFLVALSPPILLPSSSLQRLAKLAGVRRAQQQPQQPPPPSASSSPHSPQQPSAMSYHHAAVHGALSAIPVASSSSPDAAPSRVRVFHALHSYRLVNDATRVEAGCFTSYLSLHSLQALPDVVHTLQQCIVFHQLYASMHSQHPSTQPSTLQPSSPLPLLDVEVTAFPPHSIRFRVPHPVDGLPDLLVGVRVAPVASADACGPLHSASALPYSRDCHLVSAELEASFDAPPPCSDRFATELLAMTLSIPLLVHAIYRKAAQQQHTAAAAAVERDR